jgi:lysozyme
MTTISITEKSKGRNAVTPLLSPGAAHRMTGFHPIALLLAGFTWCLAGGPASADYLYGIDVSHHQKHVNWHEVKNAGYSFGIAKASEGLDKHSTFDRNWANMKKVTIIRGAYHYALFGMPAVEQADFFYQTVQPAQGDLWLFVDLEYKDNEAYFDGGAKPEDTREWIRRFTSRIQELSGQPAIIYTGPNFWKAKDRVGNPVINFGCPLWISEYGVASPKVPRAWPTWTFWQYAIGQAAGVRGHCDLDYFNGSLNDLQAFTFP